MREVTGQTARPAFPNSLHCPQKSTCAAWAWGIIHHNISCAPPCGEGLVVILNCFYFLFYSHFLKK